MLYGLAVGFLLCVSIPTGVGECQLGGGGRCVCQIGDQTYLEGQEYYSYIREDILRQQEAADVVFIVDESKSMIKEHNWLKRVATTLDDELRNAGIGSQRETPNRFGLTTFGGKGARTTAGKIVPLGNDGSKMGTPEQLTNALGSLALTGRLEDGYQGISTALNGYQFRPDSSIAKQFILVTDEDRDELDSTLSFNNTLENLLNGNITLNAAVKQSFHYNGRPAFGLASAGKVYLKADNGGFTSEYGGAEVKEGGDGSTYKDYVRLALETGGASWDLELLRKGGDIADSFTKAFIDVKLQEIIRQIRSCRQCTCTRGRPDVCDTLEVDTQDDCLIPSVPTPEPTQGPLVSGGCKINGKTLNPNKTTRQYVIKTSETNGYPTADVIFVVDESGSMVGEHAWLNTTIYRLDDALKAEGIGVHVANRYGLVGFATIPNINGAIYPLSGEPHQMGSPDEFAKRIGLLKTAGQVEDGYRALITALNAFQFRTGNVARQIILVTDEDRDDSDNGNGADKIERKHIKKLIVDKDFRINVIVNHAMQDASGNTVVGIDDKYNGYNVDPLSPKGYRSTSNAKFVKHAGHGSTMVDYVKLALNTEGAAWDLNQLRRGGAYATAFTNSFVDAKVKEISEQLKVCQNCICRESPPALECTDVPGISNADECYRPHACKLGNKYIDHYTEHCGFFIFENFGSNGRGHAAADVLIVVDESRSMMGEHRWLGNVIPQLEEALKAKSVGVLEPNKYTLIGFANEDNGRLDKLGTVIMVMGSAEDISNAIKQNQLRQSGKDEDGYSAIMRGLQSTKFRKDKARLVILVTDEDRDNLNKDINNVTMYEALINANAILNVVINQGFHSGGTVALGVGMSHKAYFLDTTSIGYKTKENGEAIPDSAYGTTDTDYTQLAIKTGGAAWDLNRLRKGGQIAEAFTKVFVAVKVEEALSQLETCYICGCNVGQLSCHSYNLTKKACSQKCAMNYQFESLPGPLPLEVEQRPEEVHRLVRAEVLPSDVEICAGDIPLVTCKGSATGNGKVKLQWKHKDQPAPSRRLNNDKQNPEKELKAKVKTAAEGGEFVCTATANGNYRAIAVTNVTVADTCQNTCGRFFGQGYARVLRGNFAQRNIDVRMKVCPTSVISGILYCFEGGGTQRCSQCLALSDGFLELRWPCCLSEPAQLFQQYGVAPNLCHTIHFTTSNTEAILRVNGERAVLPLTSTCWNEFQPSRPVYLGGRPFTEGYNGCMSDIRVDKKQVFFSRDGVPLRGKERVLVVKKKNRMMRCTTDCLL